MILRVTLIAIAFLSATTLARAVDHRIEKLAEAAPADAIGQEIAGKLEASGVKVVRGESRIVCELWLCKDLDASGGSVGAGIQYPLAPGQLVGVVRFPRKAADFRDQDLAEGVYTLRYALQPVDGAHVGTFPTRDFLVLSKAESDQTAAPVEAKMLVERGTEVSETNHPALLALLKLEQKSETYPGISHDEEHDWWIARLEAATKSGANAGKLPVDVVVVGHASE